MYAKLAPTCCVRCPLLCVSTTLSCCVFACAADRLDVHAFFVQYVVLLLSLLHQISVASGPHSPKITTVIQTVAASCHNCLSVLLSFCLAPMQDIFGPSFKPAWPSLSVSCESCLPTWDMAACTHFLTSPELLRPFFDDSVAVSYSSS